MRPGPSTAGPSTPDGADVTPRYRSDNIGSWTGLRARRDPHRTALVVGAERTDYAQLESRSGRVAGALREALGAG